LDAKELKSYPQPKVVFVTETLIVIGKDHDCFQRVIFAKSGARHIADLRNTRPGCAISLPSRKRTTMGLHTMQDILGRVESLKRPPLLVRAARFGLDDYNRAGQLPRLLRCLAPPRSGEAILRLLDLEADLEDLRHEKAAEYSVARHVEVIIALMAEARLLRAIVRPAEPTGLPD
jgi:hypothetical protein